MDMENTESSLDTTDNPEADTLRLASGSSFHTVPPPQRRRRAVLWVLANLVILRTQQQRELTVQDFIDFKKRTKWKLYQSHKREASVGNYLSVVDMGI